MAQLNRLGENRRFALTFHEEIEEQGDLIRYGYETGPIRDLRCNELSQYSNSRRRPVDFLTDRDGYVITERSSGNFCSQHTKNQLGFHPITSSRYYSLSNV